MGILPSSRRQLLRPRRPLLLPLVLPTPAATFPLRSGAWSRFVRHGFQPPLGDILLPPRRRAAGGFGPVTVVVFGGVRGTGAGVAASPPAAAPAEAWRAPPPSKKELWRQHRRQEEQAGSAAARERHEISPEMVGLCFRCILPGHVSKDCKRPRSPSPEEELRRLTASKVARREPGGAGGARGRGNGSPCFRRHRPPPTVHAAPAAWPRIVASRLQSPPAEELAPNDLCTTRRTMGLGDLERRLQLAMVAYVGGANRGISPEFVLEALSAQLDIGPEWLSVYPFRPEDFLVVFGRSEHRNLMASKPSIDHLGRRIFFRPWNRQAQAVHSRFSYKVSLVLEGIPPHAWDREVVEDLLGCSCMVDMVAPESSSRRVLSTFKLTTWTADPEAIPTLWWLAIPEPGLFVPMVEPALLQYTRFSSIWNQCRLRREGGAVVLDGGGVLR
ncbi:hypothetical protein CFC21_075733 [Triticum aestivum]|uniref:CCHC-type domain-containing protein n=2 Tax=Triticum aestivum TaxID=4565 RepID=A0A3B6MK95_WHEAT|nr:hypothetical protein CFC21_075733 [Triticum aestivum]